MPEANRFRGAAVTLGGQWAKYVLQLLSLFVLARLLGPSDFGLIAMATAFIGIANVIGDFGLSLAAIQARDFTDKQRANLFWLNGAIGTATTVLLCGAASPIAAFYDEPRLIPLTIVMSLSFIVVGFTTQLKADLNRNLQFNALALSDVLGQLGALVLAIASALAGAGFWALALQQLSFVVISGLIVTLQVRRWPGWPSRGVPMRHLLTYGGNTFLTQVVNYISANADSVVIGQRFGAVTLGFYNRAFQIMALPVQQLATPLTRIALPILSRVDDTSELSRTVLKIHTALSYFLVSLLSLLAAMAHPAIRVILGEGYEQSAVLLQILSIGGLFQALAYSYYWVFLSTARTGLLFWSELSGRAIMVAGMILLVPLGPEAVAAASATGYFIIWLVGSAFTVKRTGVDARPLVGASLRVIMVTGCGFLAVHASVLVFGQVGGLLGIVVYTPIWFAGAAITLLVRGVRSDARDVLAVVSSFRR